jgi:hypothetical protein
MKEVLTERFQGTTIGDLKHRVLVPAVNYSTGRGSSSRHRTIHPLSWITA